MNAGESDMTGDTASPGGGRGTDGPWVHSEQRLPKHEREVQAMKAVTGAVLRVLCEAVLGADRGCCCPAAAGPHPAL
mgnify:CR=1 FL=1